MSPAPAPEAGAPLRVVPVERRPGSPGWIAPPATRELRELVRHRAKLGGLRPGCWFRRPGGHPHPVGSGPPVIRRLAPRSGHALIRWQPGCWSRPAPRRTVCRVVAAGLGHPSLSNPHSGGPDLMNTRWGYTGDATSQPVTLTDLSVRLNVFGTAADRGLRGFEVGLPTSRVAVSVLPI